MLLLEVAFILRVSRGDGITSFGFSGWNLRILADCCMLAARWRLCAEDFDGVSKGVGNMAVEEEAVKGRSIIA